MNTDVLNADTRSDVKANNQSESPILKRKKTTRVLASDDDDDNDDSVVVVGKANVNDENENGAEEEDEDDDDYAFIKIKRKKLKDVNNNNYNAKDDEDEVEVVEISESDDDEAEEVDEEEEEEEEEEDDDDGDDNEPKSSKGTRLKLRKMIDDEDLNRQTKAALKAEQERKKRLETKKRQSNLDQSSTAASVRATFCLDSTDEQKKKTTTSKSKSESEIEIEPTPLISVDPELVRVLKEHQFDGIQFMWDVCYEKVSMIANGHKGSGCILAHCMGLGKTLQVIALVHTVLAHADKTRTRRVLILVPKNVLTNWKNEFAKWTQACRRPVNIFEMPYSGQASKLHEARLAELEEWSSRGGVCIMGYSIFNSLVHGKSKTMSDGMNGAFKKHLCAPGADLIICDEGHVFKNEKTQIAKAVYQVATKRRIVLTGTPLQNNLEEYYCMVSFVKPNLLGTLKEFRNRFSNPIRNGQHKDSTVNDVRIMKMVGYFCCCH